LLRLRTSARRRGVNIIEFKFDGETALTESVDLAGGESAIVSFDETWSAGDYLVSVEDLTETVIVAEEPVIPFWMRPEYAASILIVIVSAVAIIYVI